MLILNLNLSKDLPGDWQSFLNNLFDLIKILKVKTGKLKGIEQCQVRSFFFVKVLLNYAPTKMMIYHSYNRTFRQLDLQLLLIHLYSNEGLLLDLLECLLQYESLTICCLHRHFLFEHETPKINLNPFLLLFELIQILKLK